MTAARLERGERRGEEEKREKTAPSSRGLTGCSHRSQSERATLGGELQMLAFLSAPTTEREPFFRLLLLPHARRNVHWQYQSFLLESESFQEPPSPRACL